MILPVIQILVLLAYSAIALAQDGIDGTEQQEIDYLLTQVANSDCTFTRNFKDYTGEEAVGHIKFKYKYFVDEISTTEDFIRLSATKSEISGMKYKITCEDVQQELGAWLDKLLTEYRNQQSEKE